jgi:hypothetical protein
LGFAEDFVDAVGVVVDVAVELHRQEPSLKGIRGVKAILECVVVGGSETNRIRPARAHESFAVDFQTMAQVVQENPHLLFIS